MLIVFFTYLDKVNKSYIVTGSLSSVQ